MSRRVQIFLYSKCKDLELQVISDPQRSVLIVLQSLLNVRKYGTFVKYLCQPKKLTDYPNADGFLSFWIFIVGNIKLL